MFKVEHRNKERKFYNSSLKLDGLSFDILYVASPWGPLPSFLIKCPWGQNRPRPGGHKMNIRTKNENFIILLI